MRDELDELANRIYNTVALSKFLSLKEKGEEVDIDSFLENHRKEWPKWRGDLRQIARQYKMGKL